MTDDLDRMLQGGAKSAKFERAGDSITGVVTEVLVRQATEFGTGAPQTFKNGDPREKIIVVIKAEGVTPEDPDDDLHRAVYIKGWGVQRRAFTEAVKAGGKPKPGDRFTATMTGTQPSPQGGYPSKVFEYRVQSMQAEADAGWASQGEVNDARAQAQKLLNMGGLTSEQISRATGLPLDEVTQMNSKAYPDDTPF